MPMREFYTIDRSPSEIRQLWDWATEECHGKIVNEHPYAMGVLFTLEYLMGETEELPQAYKGDFKLANILRQSEQSNNIGAVRNASINEPLNNGFHSLRPGNPKCLLYDTPKAR